MGRNGGFSHEPSDPARTRSFFDNPLCVSLVHDLTCDVMAVNMVLAFNRDFLTHVDYPDSTRVWAHSILTRYKAAARAFGKFSNDYGIKWFGRSHHMHGS